MGCTLVCYYTVIVVQAVFWGLLVLELRRTRRLLQSLRMLDAVRRPVFGGCLICGGLSTPMWGVRADKMICRDCLKDYSQGYSLLKVQDGTMAAPSERPDPPPAPPPPPSQ